MASQAPRVSLGMPVYNAERFLREVLDSIVAQTFTNWELIISDNGSLDATGNICREYAARDARIQYYPNDGSNHGPAWNYNRTEALAKGDLFKWAAADDLLAPRFLEQCVSAMDANPDAVMASPLTRVIDEDSKPIRDCKFTLPTDSPKVGVRFGSLINVNHKRHEAFEIFALIRTNALRSFPRKGAYARADSVVLARLSLFGRFHQVQEVLFLNRDHRGRSVRSVPSRLTRGRSRLSKFIGVGPIPPTEWWDASKTREDLLPGMEDRPGILAVAFFCSPDVWAAFKVLWGSHPLHCESHAETLPGFDHCRRGSLLADRRSVQNQAARDAVSR